MLSIVDIRNYPELTKTKQEEIKKKIKVTNKILPLSWKRVVRDVLRQYPVLNIKNMDNNSVVGEEDAINIDSDGYQYLTIDWDCFDMYFYILMTQGYTNVIDGKETEGKSAEFFIEYIMLLSDTDLFADICVKLNKNIPLDKFYQQMQMELKDYVDNHNKQVEIKLNNENSLPTVFREIANKINLLLPQSQQDIDNLMALVDSDKFDELKKMFVESTEINNKWGND